MSNEFVTFLANIALTLSVAVAVIFGIAQIRTAAKDRRERLTIDTLQRFQTREFADTLQYMSNAYIPVTYAEWRAMAADDQTRFIHLCQQMESLGLLLAEKSIGIDLVDKTLGSFVSSTWNRYKPLITDMREKRDDPYLNEYFQWMAEQIEKRMAECPRPPFHQTNQRAT